MPLSDKTRLLLKRRWVAFCKAVVQAQEEHGAPVECYFGEGQTVCDRQRLMDYHDRRAINAQSPYEDGGAVLADLPNVEGFAQDGGGW